MQPMMPEASAPSQIQQLLQRRAWDAANDLRGSVDASDYKIYILPLLFFKRVSDIWDWEYQRDAAEVGEEWLEDKPLSPRFNIPPGCHWSDVRQTVINQGHKLRQALTQIEAANPDSLQDIFGQADWANTEVLPEATLRKLIEDFSTLDLNPDQVPNEVLGQVYEFLLMQFADLGGQHAEAFFTPTGVNRLLMRLLDPKEGESVYDPACGAGGMLVEAINEIREFGGKAETMRVFGQEINLTTSAIARMNLFLHDFEEFEVRRGDTLRRPAFTTDTGALRTFDIVLSNPPYSVKNWGEESWAADPYGRANNGGVPPANNADMAWLQHCLASLKSDTGRAAVIMPHGPLFRGNREGKIRQWLIDSGYLDAVMDIPRTLFYRTSIPNSVWIMRTDRRRGDTILLIDAVKQFIPNPTKQPKNAMSASDVEAIVEAYRTGVDVDKVRVRQVPVGEIKANGYDLNIGRYLGGAEEEKLDVDQCRTELEDAVGRFQARWAELAEMMGDLK